MNGEQKQPEINWKMRAKNLRKTILSLAAIIVAFGAITFLSNFIEANRHALPENYADADLSLKGAKLKDFSFGLNGLLADFYWMQSLQYVGNKVLNSKTKLNLENLRPLNPRLLYPMLDNATDLDPRFFDVYAYGAIVLPAVNSEQAIQLIEKGIRNNPNRYEFYQHLGYIYWKLGDYEKASEVYAEGSKIPDAPAFLKLMSAKMKTDGGSRETSREIYRQMYEQTADAQIKETATLRLAELDSLDERDAIRKVLQNFKEKNNRCAENWREIFLLLNAVNLPNGKDFRIDKSGNIVDPTNVPYILDKQNCDVKLDPNTTKIPH